MGKLIKGNTKILIIDDEQGIRDLLSYELSSQGYDVSTARDGEDGIEKLKKDNFQLVISDVKMPRMDGVRTLEEIKKISPETEVIMATGYGTIETAVAALKKGAYDFVQKPFNVDEILSLIEKALEKAELKSLIALYETSKAIFSAVKLDELLPILVKLSINLLKADDVSIMLMGSDKKLYIAVSHGLDGDIKKDVRLAIGERVAGRVAKWEESCIIVGPLSEDDRFKEIDSKEEIKSSIISPLKSKDGVIGVLCATRTSENSPFNSSDQRYTDIFSSQISQAIENAKLYTKLESKIQALNTAYAKLSDMQKELVQAEKLAAIGELASGVAHELNNPLTVVIGLVQLMIEEGMTGEKKDDLEVIKEQAERCRKIILNLLQFARKHETKKVQMNIEEVVEKALELVEYDLKGFGVKVVKEYDKDAPQVEADTFQMQQVFLNIINNAHHSLKDIEDPTLTMQIKKLENMVHIIFSDNGCGISNENLDKIFDPFFTTKGVRAGTGLGLSISYGIVQEHGGKIFVESKEGNGSTFTVELPFVAVKEA